MSIQEISGGLATYQKMAELTSQLKLNASASQSPNGSVQTQITATTSQQASLVAHIFSDASQKQENAAQMVYQAAIAKLNEILTPKDDKGQPIKGDAPISEETLKKQGGMDYWSPENTAKRIVSGAGNFLEGFKKAHPKLEGQALMDHYMEVVGGGLKQGFNEAKDILSELKVFDGQIKNNYQTTFDLVQKGMEDFKNQYLGIKSKPNPEPTTTKPINERA